jgi:HPt (histidine-containing phosphotransfer) domain-containing protein
MSNNLYDLSILSEMVYGDTDFMKELVDTFIEFAPIDAKELSEYAKAKNWEETSKKAHKLKSSIRTIGVTSLTDLILKIEEDSKSMSQTDMIEGNIATFMNTLELVIEKLKSENF